jgi:hypothetical protein
MNKLPKLKITLVFVSLVTTLSLSFVALTTIKAYAQGDFVSPPPSFPPVYFPPNCCDFGVTPGPPPPPPPATGGGDVKFDLSGLDLSGIGNIDWSFLNNPPIPTDSTCKVSMVFDRSGSVGEANLNNMRAQVRKLFETDGIYNDKIKLAFWSFSDSASAPYSFFPTNYNAPYHTFVSSKGVSSSFNAKMDEMKSDGRTNYEEGFGFKYEQANAEINDIMEASEVIVFMTDGLPNNPYNNEELAIEAGRKAAEKHLKKMNYMTGQMVDTGRVIVGGYVGASLDSREAGILSYVVNGPESGRSDKTNSSRNNIFIVNENYSNLANKINEVIDNNCKTFTAPPPPPPAEPTDSPYLRVFGNDVITGSRFPDSTGSCPSISATDDTTIRATTRTASNQWYGASSEFAVFDYGDVDQFFSNSPSTTASANPPLDLTFGNYGTKSDGTVGRITGATNYGGNSGLAPCLPDYFGDIQSKDASLIKTPGTANIPTSIANGEQKLIVVEGDVHITNNITYANTSWNNVSEIPNFYLIVKGNISIAPNVTQLDGIYVAQPNPATGNGGNIYTCLSGANATRYTGTDLTSNCGNKLTINGAFISKKTLFDRTNGRLSSAPLASSENPTNSTSTDKIAEMFNFTPETYLSPLNFNLTTTQPYEKYEYIVSLPPVL